MTNYSYEEGEEITEDIEWVTTALNDIEKKLKGTREKRMLLDIAERIKEMETVINESTCPF